MAIEAYGCAANIAMPLPIAPSFPKIPPNHVSPLNATKAVKSCPRKYPIDCACSGENDAINSLNLSIRSGSLFTPSAALSKKSSKKSSNPVPTFSANGSNTSHTRKSLKALINRGNPFSPNVHFPSGFRKCSQKSFNAVHVKSLSCFNPLFQRFFKAFVVGSAAFASFLNASVTLFANAMALFSIEL